MLFKKSAIEKARIQQEKLAAFFNENPVSYQPPPHTQNKMGVGSAGEHFLQEKYQTQQQAKEFYSRYVSKSLVTRMHAFINQQEFMFISTANKQGKCECQFVAGFIDALNEKHIICSFFDEEDSGYLKNNIHENLNVSLLIIDFFNNTVGLHINGKAKIIPREQLLQFSNNLPAPLLDKLNSDDNIANLWIILEVSEAYQQGSKNIPLLKKIEEQDIIQPTDKQPQEITTPFNYIKGNKPLLINSIFVLLCSLLLLILPAIKSPISVQTVNLSFLWHNNFWQQVTGYSILALVTIGMFMSLHRRIISLRIMRYAWWRLFHVITGVLATFLLALHTGLSLGNNYNLILMLFFISTLIIGGITGILTAFENQSEPIMTIKKRLLYTHIAVVWFLPVLLGLHILSVYYF